MRDTFTLEVYLVSLKMFQQPLSGKAREWKCLKADAGYDVQCSQPETILVVSAPKELLETVGPSIMRIIRVTVSCLVVVARCECSLEDRYRPVTLLHCLVDAIMSRITHIQGTEMKCTSKKDPAEKELLTGKS